MSKSLFILSKNLTEACIIAATLAAETIRTGVAVESVSVRRRRWRFAAALEAGSKTLAAVPSGIAESLQAG